jgi:uncharacterized protein
MNLKPVSPRSLVERTFCWAGILSLAAVAAASGATKPNLVFVFSDQHSWDMLGCYGNPDVRTPNLDRLAGEGLRFNHCVSTSPVCTPYRGILFSGQHPLSCGSIQNDVQILPGNGTYFGEVLRDGGYRTGYFGKWHLYGGDRNRGIPPGPYRYGFDHEFLVNNCTLVFDAERAYYWDQEGVTKKLYGDWEPYAQTRQAVEFIDRHADRPFALFLSWHPPHNWGRAHEGYDAPADMLALYDPAVLTLRPTVDDTPRVRAIYQGHMAMISSLDRAFGWLVDAIDRRGLTESTIVVFTADHGDLLESYGWPNNKGRAEHGSCRVPLLVRWPERLNPGTSDLLLGTLDLMPTLLGMMGLPVPSTCQGRNAAEAILTGTDDGVDEHPLLFIPLNWRGLYTRRYTYSFSILPESDPAAGSASPFNVLYDRESDPWETRNLFGDPEAAHVQRRLHARTLDWMKRFGDSGLTGGEILRRTIREEDLDVTLMPPPKRPPGWESRLKGRPVDLLSAPADRAPSPVGEDRLQPLGPGAVRVEGWLGRQIDLCIENRVMAQDVGRLVQPFRERAEENSGHWRCEYWGKWFTSAALGYACDPSDARRAKLDDAVRQLLATQTPDGYIGTYKDGKHLGTWDVWGRKYTLLGLIAHHDLTGSRDSLAAARRVADHLMLEAPPGQFNLGENGIDVLKGLAPNSILEPVVLLHARTGDPRYLDFARDIVANWEKPNAFLPRGLQLVADALDGVAPVDIASPKAYEMMSCFEGLCEMYRVSGDRVHLDAAVRFAQSIRQTERMITGSGSNQELWCRGIRAQTEVLEQPMETCVTVTWMKLCYQLLRLTGDPLWADEMEVSLYNALAGSMTPDGSWWAYFSPLVGQRVPSHFQHRDVGMSCCAANGPRALLLTPAWAVMGRGDGLAVNLYAPGRATGTLRDGTRVELAQQTDYPVGDEIVMTVTPSRDAEFALHLRIPEWSRTTTLTVNGDPVDCRPGSYAAVSRVWSAGDRVVLKLDLRGRAIPAPSGAPQTAVMRGPIVLAMDNRLVQAQDVAVRLLADADGIVSLTPVSKPPEGIWMAFNAPFEVRPTHFFNHRRIEIALCDFASAGNGWNSDNLFRTWLPQPLFLRHAFVPDIWRLMCPGLEECPAMPDLSAP